MNINLKHNNLVTFYVYGIIIFIMIIYCIIDLGGNGCIIFSEGVQNLDAVLKKIYV